MRATKGPGYQLGTPAMPWPTVINSHIIIGAVFSDSRRNPVIRRLLEMRWEEPGHASIEGPETPERAVIQASISQGSGVGNLKCRSPAGGQFPLPQAFVVRLFQVKKRILVAFKIAAP